MSKWMLLPAVALAVAIGYLILGTPPDASGGRDHDGLPDQWETRYGLSTTKDSANGDRDGDGLRNRREYRLHTNPRKRDTDGDGYGDRAEVRARTNPRDPDSRPLPSPANTGVPAGWEPERTRTEDLRVTEPGAVIEDLLLENADLAIDAPNVTVRRVKLQGGSINSFPGSTCRNGLVVENTTIEPEPGLDYGNDTEGVIGYGGYTARGVKIWHRGEGFRVGGEEDNCGPVRIEDSYAEVTPPHPCGDWHGDGLQGYGGPALTVRNVTLYLDIRGCGGTAPFFYPSGQGNTSADIDDLLVKGGGYPFRMGTAGSVSDLRIVDGSWEFGPVDVKCSALNGWDAQIVKVNADYQVVKTVRPARCEGSGN
jgi:Bacterial TSP3 repeat